MARSEPRPLNRRVEPRRRGQHGQQWSAFDHGSFDATHQKIAIVVDMAAHARLRAPARKKTAGYLSETFLLPGIEGDHEVSREALQEKARFEIKALGIERGSKRMKPWLLLAH